MHLILNPLSIVLYNSIVGYGCENTLAVPLAEFVLSSVVGCKMENLAVAISVELVIHEVPCID